MSPVFGTQIKLQGISTNFGVLIIVSMSKTQVSGIFKRVSFFLVKTRYMKVYTPLKESYF